MGSRVAGRIAVGAGLGLLGAVSLLGPLSQPASSSPSGSDRPHGGRGLDCTGRTPGTCLAAAAAAAPPRAPAARPPVAVGAAVTVDGGVTRLVVDLGAPTTVAVALTEEPDRVVLDLPEVDFEVDPAAARLDPRGVGLVQAFRFGLFAPGRSRVVLDLAGPAAVRRAEVRSIAGGDASRLVVELVPCDRAAFHEAARRPAPAAASAGLALPSPAPPPAERHGAAARPVVVIDPGHGGIDPGASGPVGLGGPSGVGGPTGVGRPGGAVEKDVVLLFSTALAARLSAGDRYRVVMTRRDDSFVSLDDRVRIAREAADEAARGGEAALMISVHADSLADGSVAGATVYTAADRASDAEAARVTAAENRSDAAAGLDDAPRAAADVSDILFDLTRRETRAYAHRFQRTLTGYWAKVARLNHNPERSAGFRVLQAPDVPSVLLELGYLSSAQDARSFGSAEWRGRAVDGVAASVDAFFGAGTAGRGAGPNAGQGANQVEGAADRGARGTAAAR